MLGHASRVAASLTRPAMQCKTPHRYLCALLVIHTNDRFILDDWYLEGLKTPIPWLYNIFPPIPLALP